MNISKKIDEFVSRQGIVSAEFCQLIYLVEKLENRNAIMEEALVEILHRDQDDCSGTIHGIALDALDKCEEEI